MTSLSILCRRTVIIIWDDQCAPKSDSLRIAFLSDRAQFIPLKGFLEKAQCATIQQLERDCKREWEVKLFYFSCLPD